MKPNAPVTLPGYQRVPESMQPHTLRVVFLQKRLWELRCSARTDMPAPGLPDTGVRPGELFALAFYVLLMGLATMWQQATKRCRAKWYQPGGSVPHHSRRKL